jgi:hypothetical protein
MYWMRFCVVFAVNQNYYYYYDVHVSYGELDAMERVSLRSASLVNNNSFVVVD